MLDIWWDMIDGISLVLTLFNEDLGLFNGDVMGEPTIWRNVMGYDITSQLEIHGSVGKWFISRWNGAEHFQHLGLSENVVPHFPIHRWIVPFSHEKLDILSTPCLYGHGCACQCDACHGSLIPAVILPRCWGAPKVFPNNRLGRAKWSRLHLGLSENVGYIHVYSQWNSHLKTG